MLFIYIISINGKMNKDYFDANEARDLKLFEEFNNEHLHLDWEPAPRNSQHDVSATTTLGRTFLIELKRRDLNLMKDGTFSGCSHNGSTYRCEGIYIEDYKLADLLLAQVEGNEALYVNFLNHDVTLVCDLHRLSEKPKLLTKLNIPSSGYDCMQRTNRYIIPINDFAIYKGKELVKKQGESWKR